MSCPPFCGKDVNHHPSNSSNLQLFFVIRLQGERASQTLFFLGKMNQTCYFPVICALDFYVAASPPKKQLDHFKQLKPIFWETKKMKLQKTTWAMNNFWLFGV